VTTWPLRWFSVRTLPGTSEQRAPLAPRVLQLACRGTFATVVASAAAKADAVPASRPGETPRSLSRVSLSRREPSGWSSSRLIPRPTSSSARVARGTTPAACTSGRRSETSDSNSGARKAIPTDSQPKPYKPVCLPTRRASAGVGNTQSGGGPPAAAHDHMMHPRHAQLQGVLILRCACVHAHAHAGTVATCAQIRSR
jgi:hypothetical protein